jgi:hypothetical protein
VGVGRLAERLDECVDGVEVTGLDQFADAIHYGVGPDLVTGVSGDDLVGDSQHRCDRRVLSILRATVEEGPKEVRPR